MGLKEVARVHVRHPDDTERWLRFTASLARRPAGGRPVSYETDAFRGLSYADHAASRYTRENWDSGCVDGVLWTVRRAGLEPEGFNELTLCVNLIEGRLGAGDVRAFAQASALATAILLGRDGSGLETEWEWTIVEAGPLT